MLTDPIFRKKKTKLKIHTTHTRIIVSIFIYIIKKNVWRGVYTGKGVKWQQKILFIVINYE